MKACRRNAVYIVLFFRTADISEGSAESFEEGTCFSETVCGADKLRLHCWILSSHNFYS